MLVLGSVGSAYRDAIVDTGRETQFLFFLAFLLSFGFIRTSAHMIRAQVSWWPGVVKVGGTHIHHLVWGICLLLICGYVGVAIHPGDPWRGIVAIGFGIGTGLTLDEFALWLNLKDVYWSEQGRRSIDAVMIAAGISGVLLVGFRGWIDAATSVEDAVFAVIGVFGTAGIVLAIINAAKEKFGIAVVSLVLPPAGVAGVFRLARPHSVWARLFYRDERQTRSEQRFAAEARA
jgi:lysyl-tRNA synthetase class 2